MSDPDPPASVAVPDRGTLVRDVIVLQFKLIVDGLRDFVLVPVSLAVGLVSFLRTGKRPGTEFYDLLHLGRRTDRLINLFGAADRLPDGREEPAAEPDLDDLVARVESFVVEEYRAGEMTAQAKARFEALRAALSGRGRVDEPPSENL